MHIGIHVKYLLFLSYLKKLEFSGQIFEKYSNINFQANLSSGTKLFHTDGYRHGEANSRFSQFCKRA